jgi:DNA-binding transcriptional LysR family regulator
MDVRYLKTFVALARIGNVTRTAERLDYAPSSVTGHVRVLEDELGLPLMHRAGRGIALTAAGRAFLPEAERIVEAERAALARIRAAIVPASTVALSSAASLAAFILPRALARARAERPDLSVSSRQGMCTDHLLAVRDGELDLALTLESREQLGRARDASMTTEILAYVPIVAVAAAGHRVARLGRVEPASLNGETLIETEPGCSYREAFTAFLDDAGVRIGTRLDFENFEAIRRCAIDGVGIAIVPRFVVGDALDEGTLVELPLRAPGEFAIAATWRPAALTDAARTVLDAARIESAALCPPHAA